MPGSTDLKAEMAACWKFSWNVDPAALIVPLAAAALEAGVLAGVEAPPDAGEPLLAGVVLDEEHAARPSAIATTAPPTVAICCLRRSCISSSPYDLYIYADMMCQYSLPAETESARKRGVCRGSPKG